VRRLRRIAAGALVAAVAFLFWLEFVWPPPGWWRTHWPAETAFMAMRERQLRSAHRAAPRRYLPVSSDAISAWLRRSAVASEDEAFYQHHGVDYRALREALGYRRATFAWSSPADRAELWRALRHGWAHRDRLRGASTITQQLARNLYLSPSRNPFRKLKEAAIAYRLEWALSKARILDLYLNVAEFGPNLWGVEAASERYFGGHARYLSLSQAALLVATLPHPLTSNPAYRPGRTLWRQQLILLKLGGSPVVIPAEAPEDTVPVDSAVVADSIVVDSGAGPRTGTDTSVRDTTRAPRDTAAAPVVRPDTAAVPPTLPPGR
jgi:monofunctional biosynthetic peptidoglycan transglycosylase